MSVIQRKDGRWICQYRIPGKKNKTQEYFGRGLEAERKARDRNQEILDSQKPIRKAHRPSPSFWDLAQAYIVAKEGSITTSTKDDLFYKLNGNILPEIGHLPTAQVTPYRIDQYVYKRLNTVRSFQNPLIPPRKIKATTVHRELSIIQAILNFAAKRQYILDNPIKGYEMPKRDDEIIQPPAHHEILAILEHSPAHLERAIVICYFTGLRPGVELFGLTFDDINWTDRTILIRSAKKGGLKKREVPLHQEFFGYLMRWKNQKRQKYIIEYKGKPISSIKKSFITAKMKAGITRRMPPYAFRHNFASILLRRGANLKTTSELLAHTRTETTTRIYQHIDMDLARDAISKLPPLGKSTPDTIHRLKRATR
ncbi:MAG TPA: site-specific integrase [Desulfobacterales bacterium]|nr:site-specific integrase [Desulfobacterales bacterium]